MERAFSPDWDPPYAGEVVGDVFSSSPKRTRAQTASPVKTVPVEEASESEGTVASPPKKLKGTGFVVLCYACIALNIFQWCCV